MSLKYCPQCGAPLKEGQVFCVECGARLEAWLEDDPTASTKAPGEVTQIMDRINQAVDADDEHAKGDAEGPNGDNHDSGEFEGEKDPTLANEAAKDDEVGRLVDAATVIDAGEDPSAPTIISPLAIDPHKGKHYQVEEEWDGDGHRYLKIFGAVTLAILVVVFILIHSCTSQNTDSQKGNLSNIVNGQAQSKDESNASDQNDQSDQKNGEAETKEESESDKEADEAEGKGGDYKTVKGYYDTLTDDAKRVNEAVETYRGTHEDDRSLREKNAADAVALTQELTAAQEAVNSTELPVDSKYHADWQNISSCYTSLLEAMDKVNYYWRYDLGYNYPSYYPQLLTDPFENDCAEGGAISNALDDYKTSYDKIRL